MISLFTIQSVEKRGYTIGDHFKNSLKRKRRMSTFSADLPQSSISDTYLAGTERL
jgi:hypothetical protein